MKLNHHKGFVRFWIASTTSNFGTYITSLALQVLVVVNLHGSVTDVGWINASRWLPYVLLGLFAGVWIDRTNLKPVLILSDISRGILLALICIMGIFDFISVGWLIFFMILFGVMSLFHDSAYQSFVPQLVPRSLLIQANARLEQSSSVAQTSGPAIAGWLVTWIGAPFAIMVDALSYILSGIVMSTIEHIPRERVHTDKFGLQIKEGLRWVYSHRYLRTLALNTHVWFLFHSMLNTVIVVYALNKLGFSSSKVGLVLAAAGIGAVLGTSISFKIGQRYGIGLSMIISRILYCPAVILMVLAPSNNHFGLKIIALFMMLLGQFIYGFAMGLEGPLEMGFRQSITPTQLQGRMNTTMRSINRSMIVIGAPLGGLIADGLGYRLAIWIDIFGLALCAVWYSLSSIRKVKLDDTNQFVEY